MSGESKTPRGRRAARLPEAAPGVSPATELTVEEMEEQQLAEEARVNSGDWNAIAPGKAQDFGRSFRRMIGLLAPWKWLFAFVSLLGAIGVVMTVIAPRVLGEATNLIFEGVISAQLPAGVSQEQVVEQLARRARTTWPTSSVRPP